MKRIFVAVTNDIVSDNRAHKICTSLTKAGFSVVLTGRKFRHSPQLSKRNYTTRRMQLLFTRGPLFYAEYNIRLWFYLIFSKTDIILSVDLDTLTACYIASKMKRKPLVYDSHEYFTEVPELVNRKRIKLLWEWLEKKMVPNLAHAITVCESISKAYSLKYGVNFWVVRNVPFRKNAVEKETTNNKNEKIILYQGAVNMGRGIEQAIKAMHFVNGAKLIIAGDGDIKPELEQLVQNENLADKIVFTGRLPFEKLEKLTPTADLGLSIEEDLGLNYRFALPNKLFDYIQARIPVLVTNLPEMSALVRHYQIGAITNSLEPETLAKNILEALHNTNKRKLWNTNLEKAAAELTWENEEKILLEIFESL